MINKTFQFTHMSLTINFPETKQKKIPNLMRKTSLCNEGTLSTQVKGKKIAHIEPKKRVPRARSNQINTFHIYLITQLYTSRNGEKTQNSVYPTNSKQFTPLK